MIFEMPHGLQKRSTSTILSKVVFSFRELGLYGFIKKCIRCIIEVEVSVVLENLLVHETKLRVPKLAVTIGPIGMDELKIAINSHDNDEFNFKSSVIEERIKIGHECIGAIHQHRLCGYTWLSTNFIRRSQDTFITEPSDIAYMFDSFVLPEYRRLGIALAIYQYQMQLLKTSICKKLIGLVSISNHASRAALRKTGFEERGKIFIITIMRKKSFFITRGIKRSLIRTIESLRGRPF